MHRAASLLVLSFLLAALAGCRDAAAPTAPVPAPLTVQTKPQPPTSPASPTPPAASADLLQARASFTTTITGQPNFKKDGPPDRPPARLFRLIRYTSPAGELAAFVSPDPGDGKKHPALLYAHGGFGGINGLPFGQEAFAPFRQAGFVIMVPSWRGENDNPGQFEMFYGEIDDAVAAIEHLARLPYVDPTRIYMVGHSTGGTITLLTAETNPLLRAAFSFGGAPDLRHVDYGNTPFNRTIPAEVRLRSAINFVQGLKVPTFYFEGNVNPEGQPEDGYIPDARRMQSLAGQANAPFAVYIVDGANHFNLAGPMCHLLAAKLARDTGPQLNVTFTPDEVTRAFHTAPRPKPR